MKAALTWGILLMISVGCIAVWWLPDAQEHAPRAFDKILLLKGFSAAAAVIILSWVPMWIIASNLRVKKAIVKAQEPNYEGIRHWLHPNGFPLFPSPRCHDIVLLLKQLYTTPSRKPELKASNFSKYFATCGQGYFLTLEGKLKMLERINSGFLSGKFMDDYEAKDIGRIVRNLIVVAVVIELGASIIGAIADRLAAH